MLSQANLQRRQTPHPFVPDCSHDGTRLPERSAPAFGKGYEGQFPADLQHLASPDLIALLKKIDPSSDSLMDISAVDLANLYDRLHFIADMF